MMKRGKKACSFVTRDVSYLNLKPSKEMVFEPVFSFSFLVFMFTCSNLTTFIFQILAFFS